MAFTLAVAYYSSVNPTMGSFVSHWATLCLAIVLIFFSLTGLMCLNLTKQVPINYFLLFIFTAAESVTVGNIASYYEPESVIEAMITFTITTVCLFLGSMCIRNMKFYAYGMLFSIFLSFVMQSLCLVFLLSGHADRTAFILYSFSGIIIYSVYVVIDLWMIAERIEIDDYILGAITLYVDLVTLFIHILQALGKAK